jgi:M6 family metalloprotease-like protein
MKFELRAFSRCAAGLSLAASLLCSVGLLLNAQTSDAIGRLRDWNRRLTAGSLSTADAASILRQRARSLYTLIRSDPAAALSVALPQEQIDAVGNSGAATADLLEIRGEWQGPAVAVIEDDFQHGVSRTRWRIRIEGAPVEVYFAGASPTLQCEHEVKVSGVRLGGRIAAATATVLAATAACTTTGTQHLAVILAGFPSNPFPSNLTPDFVTSAMFGSTPPSMAGYYTENSYGRIAFTGSVFGPYTLDADYGCDNGAVEQAALRAASASLDPTQYTRILIVTPTSACSIDLGGISDVGCSSRLSPSGASYNASFSFLYVNSGTSSDFLVGYGAHELGHALGLLHASSLGFGGVPLGPSAAEGTAAEYGDGFSIMGQIAAAGHFNAQEKLAMGWLNSQNVQTVQTSGTYTLNPIEVASSGLQAIKVGRGAGSSQWLWLDYRQKLGSYERFPPVNQPYAGPLVHFDDGTSDSPLHTFLLNFGAAQDPNDFGNASMLPGQTWTDPYSNLSLTVNNAGSTTSVTVTYNGGVSVKPETLNFTAPSGSTTTPSNMLMLTGGAPTSFTVTTTGNWLSTGPVSSSSTPANIMVNANPTGMASGDYYGSITIAAPGATNSPLIVPVTLTVLPTGAVGCWSFDNAYTNFAQVPYANLSDPCGGMTGTQVNATSGPGAVNQALSFSGAGSYFAVPQSNSGLELKHDLTIAAWVNTQNNSQKQNFIGKYDYSGSESGYLLQILPSGMVNLHLGGNNVTSGSRDAQDTTVIDDGRWHHVAVVIGLGQNTAFYIDGKLSSTQPQVAAASGVAAPLYLGSSPGAFNGLPYTGSLDEVQIYSRRLGADEVAAVAGAVAGLSITGITVLNPPYEGNAFNMVVNGTGFIPTATVIDPDIPDTSPNLRLLPTTFVSPTQLTVAAPRDLTMSPGTLRLQVFNTYPAGPASNISSVTVNPLTPVIGSLSPDAANAGSPTLAMTVNGSNFEAPCSTCQGNSPGAVVQWNGTPVSTTFVSGSQLSATIPAGLLASSGAASVTVVNQGNVSSSPVTFSILAVLPLTISCSPESPATLGAFYSGSCLAFGGTGAYHWSISAGSLPAALSISAIAGTATVSGTLTATGPYSYTVTVTDSGISASHTYSGTIAGPTPSSLAGCWTFDDISGRQVPDCSGNGLTGTIAGGVTMVPGRVNQALQFPGGSSYVTIPDSGGLELTHDLTLTAWVNTTNTTQKQDLLNKYDFNAAEYGYILQLLPSGVVNLRVGGNNLISGSRDVQDITAINDGQWHHVAVVITLGQSVQFFIDGQLSSTKPLLTTAAANRVALYLGALTVPYNGVPFVGSLDEVKIYSRALSASDVLTLLAGSGPVITSLNPATTPQGSAITLTVNGTGFAPGAVVVNPDVPTSANRLYRVWQTTFVSSTLLTAVVPLDFTLANGTVRVQVFNSYPNGPSSNIASFTVTPLTPVIANLSQSSAPAGGPGFQLTINGTNFVSPGGGVLEILYGSSVHWNNTNLLGDPFLSGPNQVVVTVPASLIATPGPASIAVVNPGGTASAPVTFTITSVVPPTALPPAAGHWTFDTADIGGNQAFDRSGNGLTGTIMNAAPLAQGRLGQALSFSGAGSSVMVSGSTGMELKHDLTLAAWVQTTNHTQTQDFFSKYDFTGPESGYMLQILPAGTVNLHIGGSNLASGSRDVQDATVINDGQWHHVAVVITLGQTVSFYIDGTLKSTRPVATAASGSSAPLYLGTFPGAYNGLPFAGALDDVWVFGSALNAAQVAALAGGGS